MMTRNIARPVNGQGRRSFLSRSLLAMGGVSLGSLHLQARDGVERMKTTQPSPDGYFSLAKAQGRWWFSGLEGRPFFSMGLNHIDPASLRYEENLEIWKSKYGGSTLRWIEESVAPNLQNWGFNTVGWVQEVTVKQWRHSRAFTDDEYRALDMPYCHLLPFIESHQWEKHTLHFDFRGEDWKEWCDYVARDHCAALSDEKNLIGYFYSDCPAWVHTRPFNEWKGPMFDPERLNSEAGKKELRELAKAYYQTTHDAIRRYDKHHLILGDRYEANAPLPMEIVEEAMPYVDVFSFQDFRNPIQQMDEWHKKTGKPVLLADAAGIGQQSIAEKFKPNNGNWYAETLEAMHENPGCVGFHLCGAYQRNKARGRGLLDEFENPDLEHLDVMRAANQKVTGWMNQNF